MDELPLVTRKSRRNSVKRNVKTDALVWSGGKNHAHVLSVRIPPKRPRIRSLMTPIIPLTCSLRETTEKDLLPRERFYWSIDYSLHYKTKKYVEEILWCYHSDWNVESNFHWQTIRNPQLRIQNPGLSWMTLHGAKPHWQELLHGATYFLGFYKMKVFSLTKN